MSKRSIAKGRRRFLKLAAAAGGAAAATGIIHSSQAAPAAEKPAAVQDKPESRGYHETEHIREYYKNARF